MIINNTKKFKTLTISIRFKELLDYKNVEHRSLLPNLMSSATQKYKTTKSLNEALESLYGSAISSRTYKIGQLSIIDFTLNIINPSFMEEGFFTLSLQILNDIIFGHKRLPKKYFNLEKRLLIERIESLKNNKTSFALTKLFTEMFKGQKYAIRTIGNIEKVKKLTFEDLNNYYFEVINNNDYDVVISGDINEDIIKEVNKYFKPKNNLNLSPIDRENKLTQKLNIIKDEDEISQIKLNIGYNFNVQYDHQLYNAAVLFNLIFGGYTASRLFVTVREKHNLCYYISSNFDPYKGFLYVYAGIDKNKIKLAESLIKQELEDLQTNLISNSELDLAKKQIINSLKETEDSQAKWVSSIYQQRLLNKESSLQTKIKAIESVKKEDILKVANKVVIDTVYLLMPEEK